MSDQPKSDPAQTGPSTDNESAVSGRPTRPRWYRRPKVWLFILLGCFLINLLLSVIPAFWSDQTTSYTRDKEGKLIAEDGSKINLISFRPIVFGSQEESSAHANGDSNPCRRESPTVCRRIAVFNLSTDPQMQVITQSCIKELGENHPVIERIDYYPAGETIKPGSLLPDLYIYLNGTPCIAARMLPGTEYHELQSQKEDIWSRILHQADFMPGADSYHQDVSLFCGTNPLGMDMIPGDSLTPPLNTYFFFLNINRSWRGVGIGLPILTDHWLPRQLGISLAKQAFGKSSYGIGTIEAAPTLPESLYPPFEETDLVIRKIVDQFSFSLSVSGHSLMTANESVWVLNPTKDLRKKLFTTAKEQLGAAGWNIIPASGGHSNKTSPEQASEPIFAQKGNREVVIGLIPRIAYEGSMPIGRQCEHPAERDPNQDGWIGISYHDRMSHEKVASAIKQYIEEQLKKFKEGLPEEVIKISLMYETYWNDIPDVSTSMQKTMEQMLAKSPRSLSIDTLLLLARLQYDAGNQKTAFKTLRKAAILFHVLRRRSGSTNYFVQEQAKTWEQEKLLDDPISAKELRELDFKEVQPDFQSHELIVKQDEPICLFATDQNDRTESLVVRTTLGDWDQQQQRYKKSTRYEFKTTRTHLNGSTSWPSTGGGGVSPMMSQQASDALPAMFFVVEPTNDPDKIKVTIRKKAW